MRSFRLDTPLNLLRLDTPLDLPSSAFDDLDLAMGDDASDVASDEDDDDDDDDHY